jgi:hypothetical protein
MKSNYWIYIFLLLGLTFAGFAIYFCFQPTQVFVRGNSEYFISVKIFKGKGYSTLAMAVISASCFIVAGRLIRKHPLVPTRI